MCFSAAASFAASAFLLGAGIVAVGSARTAAQRPIAAIPLLFAMQQAVEGLVLLSLDGDPASSRALGQVYVLFSHIFWPAYIPFAVWRAEPEGPRRRMLGGVAVAGLFVSVVLAWSLAVDPVTPSAAGGHIDYESSQLLSPAVMLMYLVATTGSLIASSDGFIRAFGVLAFAAFLVAYAAYAHWFISVWCFFAAWLSVVMVLHLVQLRVVQARHQAP